MADANTDLRAAGGRAETRRLATPARGLYRLSVDLCAVESYLSDIGRSGLAAVVDQVWRVLDDLYDEAAARELGDG